MNTWQQRKRTKQREQALQENIRYRQGMREVCRNEQSLERLRAQYKAQAIEAEQAGQHALAVRLAAEEDKLRKHQLLSSGMRGSLEIAHVMQSTNQAMADILVGSKNAAGAVLASTSIPNVYATQAELEGMREQVQMFLEDGGAIYDDFLSQENHPADEEGERCLQALLSSEHKEKRHKLLQDTNARLERLQHNRLTQNEGGIR